MIKYKVFFINKDLRVGPHRVTCRYIARTQLYISPRNNIHRNDRFSSFLLYSDIVQLLYISGVRCAKHVTIKIVSRFQQIRIGRE